MVKSSNKISKAPRPISPISTDTYIDTSHVFDTEVKGKTNWKYWKHISTVELWQALLLSLNINPPGNGWLIDNAPGRTGDIPYEYLDSQGLAEEFISRWKLIKNKLEHIYILAQLEPTIELTTFIDLSKFSKLAVEFEWENLPLELIVLAKNQEKNDGLSQSQNKELINTQQGLYKPRTAIGKLTLKALENIESKTKQKASAEQVMALLQQWADEGNEPDILINSNKQKRCVIWQTGKRKNTDYTIEACRKTLEKLGKSRI